MRAEREGTGEIISDNNIKGFVDMSALEDVVMSNNLPSAGFMLTCMGISISVIFRVSPYLLLLSYTEEAF